MDKAKALIVIVLIFSIASVSNALNLVYVDVSGPNNPGTGSFNDPFRKVQDAINATVDGDVVEIRPGLYTGEGNYDLDPNGKSVTIRSIDPNDSNVVASTIIDPNGAGRGFYFHSGEDVNCVISGFTLRKGYTDGSGGAIFFDNSDPTIRNCVIIDNIAASGGGGIHCYYSNPTLKNCVIAGNTTQGNGGGIWYFKSSSSRIINCTISSNAANWYGDGIYCHVSNVIITNSIFLSNNFNDSYVASGNVDVSYCDIQGGWVNGSGNVDQDPYFVSFDPNSDPNMWDFHLQSVYGRWDTGFYKIDFDKDGIVNLLDFAKLGGVWLKNGDNLPEDLNRNGRVDLADLQIFTEYYLTNGYGGEWVSDAVTSPCIDTGDPNSDWGNEPWPNGKRINMGAYGGTNQASKNGNTADFDISEAVNFVDFAALAGRWMDEQKCIEDLTGNGIVSYSDLAIVADNWLWQKE